jgi:hypothetical protein
MDIESLGGVEAGEFPFELRGKRKGRTILGEALLILRPEPVEDKAGISSPGALPAVFRASGGAEIGGPGQGEDVEVKFPGNTHGGRPAMSRTGRD